MPELQGISHIDLTVSDCEAAAAWWQDVMGFTLVNRSRGETFEVRRPYLRNCAVISWVFPFGLSTLVV